MQEQSWTAGLRQLLEPSELLSLSAELDKGRGSFISDYCDVLIDHLL